MSKQRRCAANSVLAETAEVLTDGIDQLLDLSLAE